MIPYRIMKRPNGMIKGRLTAAMRASTAIMMGTAMGSKLMRKGIEKMKAMTRRGRAMMRPRRRKGKMIRNMMERTIVAMTAATTLLGFCLSLASVQPSSCDMMSSEKFASNQSIGDGLCYPVERGEDVRKL